MAKKKAAVKGVKTSKTKARKSSVPNAKPKTKARKKSSTVETQTEIYLGKIAINLPNTNALNNLTLSLKHSNGRPVKCKSSSSGGYQDIISFKKNTAGTEFKLDDVYLQDFEAQNVTGSGSGKLTITIKPAP